MQVIAVGVVDVYLANSEIRQDSAVIGDLPGAQMRQELGEAGGAQGEVLEQLIGAEVGGPGGGSDAKIGRANVCTPFTHAQSVYCILREKKKSTITRNTIQD